MQSSAVLLLSPKLDLSPIALSFQVTKSFAEPDKWQEYGANGQRNKCNTDEAILQSHAI
jgi:hypothetical protein